MTRLSETARGVYVIAATPFSDDGALDLDSAARLTDFYLGFGIDGLTVLGIMGEAPKLAAEESRAFLKAVLGGVGGRVPVVVGASNPGTRSLAAFAHEAMAMGAAGVMVAPVPTARTEVQVEAYYAEVCAALGPDVPVVLQDYPQTTLVHMSVPTIGRILDALPQVVMVKHEDWPGLAKLSRLRRRAAEPGRRRVSILVGNGGQFLPQELARGADGAMTGFAYPEMLVEVCRRFGAGERERAEDIFDAYLPLIRHELQPGLGLALRKEILRRRGAIRCAALRTPGPRLDADDHAELDGLMRRLERRLAALR